MGSGYECIYFHSYQSYMNENLEKGHELATETRKYTE